MFRCFCDCALRKINDITMCCLFDLWGVCAHSRPGFDEGLDLEYHNATDDPRDLEPVEPTQKSVLSHGGCGSSSLRECIELLNNTERNAPATLHSRVKRRIRPTRDRL